MPVGATVVAGVLNQASLPPIGPAASVRPGAAGGPVGRAVLSPQAEGAAAGRNSLITVFNNGDTQLVSDTAVSVRVAPLALHGLGGSLTDPPEDGPVMVIAQFN